MTTTKTATQSGAAKSRGGKSTREAILDAAMRLMHVHGYHLTSLDEVLRESGVGKGNFYYHFKSKEELGYAILEGLIGDFVERTLEPCFADTTANPVDQICCFLDRVLDEHRARNCVGGCVFGNLACELSDVHEGFRTRLAVVFSAWRERLTQVLHEAHRRGDISDACHPEAVAHFLVASLEGAILLTKLTKNIAVMEQCVAEMKRYLSLYERAA